MNHKDINATHFDGKMSQRILKCTICGGPHSIFHCNNKCGVCHGDNRECSRAERPPQKKKKKTAQPTSQSSSQSYKELRKLYDNLLKEHKRVGVAFKNQQKQQEDLKKELDESTRDAEELANLVQTKSEAIKTLKTKLAQAKKTIAELKAEVETLHSDEPQQQQQQQQQIAAAWPMLSDCRVVLGAPLEISWP